MDMKSLYEHANTLIKPNEPFNEYNSIIIPVMFADNEIDKDNEMISQSALIKLLDYSIGHSAIISIPEIYDNIITGRIIHSEIVHTDKYNSANMPYEYIKSYVILRKLGWYGNIISELIAMNGKMLKTSISFSLLHKHCSICYCDRLKDLCCHTKGNYYNDSKNLCYHIISDVADVYECAICYPFEIVQCNY